MLSLRTTARPLAPAPPSSSALSLHGLYRRSKGLTIDGGNRAVVQAGVDVVTPGSGGRVEAVDEDVERVCRRSNSGKERCERGKKGGGGGGDGRSSVRRTSRSSMWVRRGSVVVLARSTVVPVSRLDQRPPPPDDAVEGCQLLSRRSNGAAAAIREHRSPDWHLPHPAIPPLSLVVVRCSPAIAPPAPRPLLRLEEGLTRKPPSLRS
jgi:hypothetical protein